MNTMSAYVDACPGASVNPTPFGIACFIPTGVSAPCPEGQREYPTESGKCATRQSPAACPSDTAVKAVARGVFGDDTLYQALCLPTSLQPTFTKTIVMGGPPEPIQCENPTDLGELLFEATGPVLKCYSGDGAPPAQPPAEPPAQSQSQPQSQPQSQSQSQSQTTPPTLADLRARYTAKLAEYDSKVAAAVASNDTARLSELRTLNAEISSLLEEMLTYTGTPTSSPSELEAQRQELVTTLNRIQRDYNGLVEKTDSFELLRRIRDGTTSIPRREFVMYFFAFLALCVGILAMLFFGVQKMDATNMSAITPPRMAPLV